MATFNVNVAKSATLAGTTADTVTLQAGGTSRFVRVDNRAGGVPLSFTIDGATATALGDDCYVCPVGDAIVVPVLPRIGQISVSVVGDGNQYTVQLL
jgi:hypothetical protein